MRALAPAIWIAARFLPGVTALLFSTLISAKIETVIVDETRSVHELSPNLEILEDPEGTLRVSDFLKNRDQYNWFRSEDIIPNLGYSQSIEEHLNRVRLF